MIWVRAWCLAPAKDSQCLDQLHGWEETGAPVTSNGIVRTIAQIVVAILRPNIDLSFHGVVELFSVEIIPRCEDIAVDKQFQLIYEKIFKLLWPGSLILFGH